MRGGLREGAFADISFFHFFSPLRFSFRAPAKFIICLAHSNRLRQSSPSLSRSPSSLRSFSPGPEVSLVMDQYLELFGLFGPVHFTFICSIHCAEFFSLTPSALSSPCPPFNRFQPAESPSPTAASRSLPPCKFGSD